MGKIELDHTGSGGGVTLSSDGTDLLLDGTAIGGGGGSPDLYSDSANGSAVTPTSNAGGSYNSVAIGNGADIGSGRGESIAIGTDSLTNQSQAIALGKAATVGSGGSFATALGRNSLANGTSATAIGTSYASGTESLAAAIATNSSSYGATGANSVAIGDRAKATGSRAFATGYASIASGNGAKAFGGFGSGTGTLASKEGSTAIGDGAKSEVSYKVAISTRSFAAQGDAQTGITTLRAQTTNTTPIALYSDTNLPDTGNQVILPNKSAFAFHGTIVARQQASQGTASAAWKVEGLIRREGSAGTTVLVNSATTVLDNTPGWGMALSADTTNGGLAITVTGAASTNIRWVSTIHTSEVTYA